MRYLVLACDYDGTIAHDGQVDEATRAALQRLRQSGRRLLLVTGREIQDLERVCPTLEIFDGIVAENGGLLYWPKTRETRLLCAPPDIGLLGALAQRNVAPISVGHAIIATWHPHEEAVLHAIHELGLELQVIFNKGAVMILPSGVNKATGLRAALEVLRISPHNCVAVGDAENDHAFLELCEAGVAVANALPSLKDRADLVTVGDHGAGVTELIDSLTADDLAELEPRLLRHHLPIGTARSGENISLRPYHVNALICGQSGNGKSSLAAAIIEQLDKSAYQFCIIDPEGDYEGIEPAISFGTSQQPPNIEEVVHLLASSDKNAVVNLTDVPAADRPAEFCKLLPRLQEIRAGTGRPHWIVVDEAHHVLPAAQESSATTLPHECDRMLYITVDPASLHRAVLQGVNAVIAVGEDAPEMLRRIAEAIGVPAPTSSEKNGPDEALFWDLQASVVAMKPIVAERQQRRHQRKYAQGELGTDRSFYFRGADGKLRLRAQNLVVFLQLAEGVDDATWQYHRERGDYSHWIRDVIKDDELADEVAIAEAQTDVSAEDSRQCIKSLIEAAYTLPQSAAT